MNHRAAVGRATGSFSSLAVHQTQEEKNLVTCFKMTGNNFICKLDKKNITIWGLCPDYIRLVITFCFIIPKFCFSIAIRLESRCPNGWFCRIYGRSFYYRPWEVLEPLGLLDYSLYPCCHDDARLHGVTEIINGTAGHQFPPSAWSGNVHAVDTPCRRERSHAAHSNWRGINPAEGPAPRLLQTLSLQWGASYPPSLHFSYVTSLPHPHVQQPRVKNGFFSIFPHLTNSPV